MNRNKGSPDFISNIMFFQLTKKVKEADPLGAEIQLFLEQQCGAQGLIIQGIRLETAPTPHDFITFSFCITTAHNLEKSIVNAIEGRLACQFLKIRGERCFAGLCRPIDELPTPN